MKTGSVASSVRVAALLALMASLAGSLALFVGCGSDDDTEGEDPTGGNEKKDGAAGKADDSADGRADEKGDACAAPDTGIGTACVDDDAGACPCNLTCSALQCVPKAGCNEALLSWTGPTQNTDGTCLTNVAGFNVRWGLDASAGPNGYLLDAGLPCVSAGMVACGDGGMVADLRCSHRITGLTNGKWFFAVSAYTDAGVEGLPSGEGSKNIACQ